MYLIVLIYHKYFVIPNFFPGRNGLPYLPACFVVAALIKWLSMKFYEGFYLQLTPIHSLSMSGWLWVNSCINLGNIAAWFNVTLVTFLQQDRERTETWNPDSHHRPSCCLLPGLSAPHCVTVTPTHPSS